MNSEALDQSHETPIRPVLRDSRLDALRGLFLIIILIDHLPSVLKEYTYELFGYVSAAEGFVFLSGFVAGLTYTRLCFEQVGAVMRRRALRRARTIYLYHAATFLVLFFTLRACVRDENYWQTWSRLLQMPIWKACLMALTFLYQPKFLDVLPMYTVFVILTPWLVKGFRKGRGGAILGASLMLWTLAQFGLRGAPLSVAGGYPPIYLGDFDVFAWQVLFVSGAYCGYRNFFRPGEKPRFHRGLLFYASLVVAVGLFLFRHQILVNERLSQAAQGMADKRTFGILRGLNFAALALLVTVWFRRIGAGFPINGLAYLGKHSLQVFAFQTVLVGCVVLTADRYEWSELTRLEIMVPCIASLWAIAWCREWRKRPKIPIHNFPERAPRDTV